MTASRARRRVRLATSLVLAMILWLIVGLFVGIPLIVAGLPIPGYAAIGLWVADAIAMFVIAGGD